MKWTITREKYTLGWFYMVRHGLKVEAAYRYGQDMLLDWAEWGKE